MHLIKFKLLRSMHDTKSFDPSPENDNAFRKGKELTREQEQDWKTFSQ